MKLLSWSHCGYISPGLQKQLYTNDEQGHKICCHSPQAYQLLIIKNEVEVAQFQNNIPEYLPLSEEFWRALSALPNTYDPAAYRSILQLYGTHYMAEGSLGGEYQLLLEFDSQFMSEMSTCYLTKICCS